MIYFRISRGEEYIFHFLLLTYVIELLFIYDELMSNTWACIWWNLFCVVSVFSLKTLILLQYRIIKLFHSNFYNIYIPIVPDNKRSKPIPGVFSKVRCPHKVYVNSFWQVICLCIIYRLSLFMEHFDNESKLKSYLLLYKKKTIKKDYVY